jgi:WD40 repeat protein
VLLDDCLQVISPQTLGIVPDNLDQRLSLLLKYLQQFRALVVLDNLEALLEEGNVKGRFRPGYEDYGRLLRRVGETTHQSSLLLTSREKSAEIELRRLEGKYGPVRALRLSGLSTAECEQLLAEKGVIGTPQDRAHLTEIYAGNPLALKIVAETISQRFDGKIAPFLSEDLVIFGNITNLLDEQFARLSPLEQTVICWLAIVREPVTLDELRAVLITPPPHMQLLEAIESLNRRSLIERGQRSASFTLQAVVLEYVTAVLIKEATHELQQHQLKSLIQYGLEQASAREYVRQIQERLLLTPIIENLRNAYQEHIEVEALLLSQLDQIRQRANYAQGYGPTNLIALLRLQRGHLRGLDLSQLTIRGAYLQGIEMQDTALVGALIQDTIFTEALDAIWSVATSRTGQYWAAGSWRGEVRVWHKEGRRLHLAWQAHSDTVFTLAFSPDESMLATGSWDGSVKQWDLQSGALLGTYWHTDAVYSVVFSPDGRVLASSGNDATIQLRDMPSGKHIQTLVSQEGAVDSVDWSPDGLLLASGCSDGNIQLWQLQEGQPAICNKTLIGHTSWVHSLAFAPDGTQLVSGSWDSTVKLWDVASGQVRQTLTGHTQRVDTVAWSPDGRTVASASFDGMIWLWDVTQNRYHATLHGHSSAVYNLAFTPDSSSLLSGSEDSTIRVWDVTRGQCIRTIKGYAISFYGLTWSPDGRWLASAGSDLQVTLWEITGETQPRELRGHNWIVYGVAWSPDGQLLASGGWDNAIRLWEPTTGTCLQVLQNPDYDQTLFQGVAWSPDGRQLASGSYMYGVQVWDMTTQTRCWVGRQSQTRIRHVAWSPDGTQLASCGDDGLICLWRSSDGTLIERLQGQPGEIMDDVAWSPDGTRLASGGRGRDGGELFVWDVANGGREKRVQAFSGLAERVFSVAWSPNGKMLVSGDCEGKLQWWEVESGECLATREGHGGVVHALKISPDGYVLASSGDDSTIRLWNLQSGELLRILRRDRPYERLNITGIRGLTEAQKTTLRDLGAIDEETNPGTP